MTTFSAPSWAMTHEPTIGSNAIGDLPTVSLLKSTFVSAACSGASTPASATAVSPRDIHPFITTSS